MTMKRKSSPRNLPGRRSKASVSPGLGNAVYNGPMRIPGSSNARDRCTVRLTLAGTLSSGGGGTLAIAQGNGPANFTDGTDFNALYSEFRVLSYKFKYEPTNQFSNDSTNVLGQPMTIAWDSTGNTSAPTAHTDISSFSSSVLMNTSRPFTKNYKMAGMEEANFLSTATAGSTNTVSFKAFADTLKASSVIGRYQAEILVQYRGRK